MAEMGAEVQEDPQDPVPEPPVLRTQDAFYSQPYFAVRDAEWVLDEGIAYLQAPSILEWDNVERLQSVLAAADLSNNIAELTRLTTWARLASLDALTRQQFLCHPEQVPLIREDRYEQEVVWVSALAAAVATLDLAHTQAIRRLEENAPQRTRTGGGTGSPLQTVRASQETLDEIQARLDKALSVHEQTGILAREKADADRQGLTRARARGPRQQPESPRSSEQDNYGSERRERHDSKHSYAANRLDRTSASDKYNHFDDANFITVEDHLAVLERKFRAANRAPLVVHLLTAEQKKDYALDSMEEVTRRTVESVITAQRNVSLTDGSGTVGGLEKIWEFEVDSLEPPTLPRTAAEARTFPQLLMAILPKGLMPLDKRRKFDAFVQSLYDRAFNESPQFVAARLRVLAAAIPRMTGSGQGVHLDDLLAKLREYVGFKRSDIANDLYSTFEDRRRAQGVTEPEAVFNLYVEVAESRWQSNAVLLSDTAAAKAQARLHNPSMDPHRKPVVAFAAERGHQLLHRPRRAPQTRLAAATQEGESSAYSDSDNSSDDRPSDEVYEQYVFAMCDAEARGTDILNHVRLVPRPTRGSPPVLSEQELCGIVPAGKKLCFRCGSSRHLAAECHEPATEEQLQRENFLKAQLFRRRRGGGWRPINRVRSMTDKEIISDKGEKNLFVISTDCIPYLVSGNE